VAFAPRSAPASLQANPPATYCSQSPPWTIIHLLGFLRTGNDVWWRAPLALSQMLRLHGVRWSSLGRAPFRAGSLLEPRVVKREKSPRSPPDLTSTRVRGCGLECRGHLCRRVETHNRARPRRCQCSMPLVPLWLSGKPALGAVSIRC